MNLSFAGCGFLGIYHVGVASCFKEYAPHVLVNKIAGASAGSIAACALLCGVSIGDSTTDVLDIAMKARSRTLGPLHPGFDINRILYDRFTKLLPEDAHLRCSGRLFISVTRASDGKNVLLSQFHSKADLIQALLCSCFIPMYSGVKPPKFHGVRYMDGGISDNLPILDENTITVSPFSGESDICPQDNSFNILQFNISNTSIAISPMNLYRCSCILFPPHPEVLSKMCQQGFDDALKFLQRNDLISCTRCLAVQTSFALADLEDSIPENEELGSFDSGYEHSYDDCQECRTRRQIALLDGLPEQVVKAIQEACDQVNKGVINWLFGHRPMKLLSILCIPYVLPVDITIVVFCKIWQMMPLLQKELQSSLENLLTFAKSLANKLNRKRHQFSAKFSCQLAITEFDYSAEDRACSQYIPFEGMSSKQDVILPMEKKFMKARKTSVVSRQAQRKSYAGISNVHSGPSRRKSMFEMRGPERIIGKMNFGFTVDIDEHSKASRREEKEMVESLKTLRDDSIQIDAEDLANKALQWEREYLGRCQSDLEPDEKDTVEKIIEVTSKNDALMSYYYKDENKRLKVTKIYNITDDNPSPVLSSEERRVNSNLQWDTNWETELSAFGRRISPQSVSHSVIKEAPTSLAEAEHYDTFPASTVHESTEIEHSIAAKFPRSPRSSMSRVPKRKSSFIMIKE